jgi:hypothetical protein
MGLERPGRFEMKSFEVAVVGALFEASNCLGSGVERAPRVLSRPSERPNSGAFKPIDTRVSRLFHNWNDPAHVQEIASSISLLGFCDPLLVGPGNELIDGEARCEAAKQLGLDRVPCVCIDHLNPDEQRVLRLAVNRLGEKGQWDLDA